MLESRLTLWREVVDVFQNIANGEAALIVLAHLRTGVGYGAKIAETRDVHGEEISRRFTLNHPFGKRQVHPATLAKTRHDSASSPLVTQTWNGPDEWIAVRGQGERPANDLLDAGTREHWVLGIRDIQLVADLLQLVCNSSCQKSSSVPSTAHSPQFCSYSPMTSHGLSGADSSRLKGPSHIEVLLLSHKLPVGRL